MQNPEAQREQTDGTRGLSGTPWSSGRWLLYGAGRLFQLIGMWLLLVALFTAGPLGPSPRLFGAGIAVFGVGWALVKAVVRRRAGGTGRRD